MYKPFVTNRIIDNEYEMYKNKLLYTALKNAKPVTKASWHKNELPVIKKKHLLEMKDRSRIKTYLDIAQENLRFFNQLSRSKSSYNLDKQMQDFAKAKKYSNNIRRCKNLSLPKNLLANNNRNITKMQPNRILKSPMSEMSDFVSIYNKNSKYSTGTNFYNSHGIGAGGGRTLSGISNYNNNNQTYNNDSKNFGGINANSIMNINNNNNLSRTKKYKLKENNLSFSVSPYFTKMVEIPSLGECCVEVIYQKSK